MPTPKKKRRFQVGDIVRIDSSNFLDRGIGIVLKLEKAGLRVRWFEKKARDLAIGDDGWYPIYYDALLKLVVKVK